MKESTRILIIVITKFISVPISRESDNSEAKMHPYLYPYSHPSAGALLAT